MAKVGDIYLITDDRDGDTARQLALDDIWRVSGFSSRSSVVRILNKYVISPQSCPFQRAAG